MEMTKEIYSFSATEEILIGTSKSFVLKLVSAKPMMVRKIIMNAPTDDFIKIDRMHIEAWDYFEREKVFPIDAFKRFANTSTEELKTVERIDKTKPLVIHARYTGKNCTPYWAGYNFLFCVIATGPVA